MRPHFVERSERVELPGGVRRDHRHRFQPRQPDGHILDQRRRQMLGHAGLLEILQRRQQHDARHEAQPRPILIGKRAALIGGPRLRRRGGFAFLLEQVGGFRCRLHAEAVPQPVAEGGEGGPGAAFVVLRAEQFDGGAAHHVGIGQALGQAEQRRVGAAAADAQGSLGRLGGELILDAGALQRQPLVELAADAGDAGQQFSTIERDQAFQFRRVFGSADPADLAQIENDVAIEFDLGSIGVEQVEPVSTFEFTRMQQGLTQIGHRLFGSAAFPGAFCQCRASGAIRKVEIQHRRQRIGLLTQLYCRTIRQAEDRGPQELQGDRFTHRSDRHCSIDPTKEVEVYLTK